METKKTYETCLHELETLVQRVEDPNRSLAEVLEDVRKGKELVAFCREYLREKEVEMS